MGIQWTRVLYSVVITRHSNPPISQFNSVMNSGVSGQCLYTIPDIHCIAKTCKTSTVKYAY